jgi:O-antigen/teichoic acid export membrane protein
MASVSALRNGLYNLGGQVARGGIALLTVPFLIRLLGISEYGVWSLACAFLALMTMCEAGFSVAATVFLSKDLAKNDTREAGCTLAFILISATLLSAAMGLLLWFAGPLLIRHLTSFGPTERAGAARALQIAGMGVATLILQRTLVGIEQAFNQYGAINTLDLAQAFLTNVGLVAIAWWGGKTVVMMKWQVVASVLLLAAHTGVVFRLFRSHKLHFGWSGSKGRQIFRYSLATWTTTLGIAAFGQCDRLIVGWILGAPSLGIYSAITNITSKINSLSATAVQPLVPSLSRDHGVSSATRRVREAVQLNALIAVGAGLFLFVLADWVIRVLAGPTGREGTFGLQIATGIYALYSLNAPGFFILYSLGKASTNAVVTLWSGAISLVLIFLGARSFGLMGAFMGNAGYLGTLLLAALSLKKIDISLRQYLEWMFSPLLWLVSAVVVAMFLQNYFWWRVGFVASASVGLSLWFLRRQADVPWIRYLFPQVSESLR